MLVTARIASFGLTALLLLALPGVLIAVDGDVWAPSEVRIRYSASAKAFRGRVDSPRRACEDKRTVNVFRVRPGPDKKIGSDRTNYVGRYRVTRRDPNGRFYAKVPRKVVSGYNQTIVCGRGESRRVTVRRSGIASSAPGSIVSLLSDAGVVVTAPTAFR